MRSELTYSFDELPLIVDLGFDALLVNGEALITYFDDSEWFVSAIYSEGFRKKTSDERAADIEAGRGGDFYFRRLIEIETGSAFHTAIYSQLMDRCADHISDAVAEQLTNSGVSIVPQSSYRQHSTLNHAQQGV